MDFAIHFLQRCRAFYHQTGSLPKALGHMYAEPGRAIVRNAVVIALGFTPLLFAPLVPYVTVGFFMAAIMAVSALATLLLLPAALLLGQRLGLIFQPALGPTKERAEPV